jgi:hypothetical protein
MGYPKNLLDAKMLALSDSDFVRFRDLIEGGTLITGGLGSGKSSTSARALALSFLGAGLGGLVLTVKSDETPHWIEYARQTGREKDLVIFNAESGLVFDPLAYMWNTGGRAAAHIETIVELFSTLMSVGKQHVGINNDRYWELACEELMRSVIVMLSAAGERISIASIHQIITSLPVDLKQADDPKWLTSTPCGRLITKLSERRDSYTSEQLDDLDIAVPFALVRWPQLDPRTSSNILSTWSGMASKFTFHPFSRMFCSGRFDFAPEQTTHERKIVILDMPVLEYGRETSRLCQILIKIIFQRAWLRHQFKAGCCNGAFLFQDEFALLMHRHENHFHMVCRGSGIAPVCITPNILNIAAEEFGEQKPGAKTLGFLGLLSLKIFHNQTDIETCNYAADQIGKIYRFLNSYHTGGSAGPEPMHSSFGGSQQLVHIVEPVEFTRLLKPDGNNPLSTAIVYQSGKIFNATRTEQNPEGLNYLPVCFSRE